MSDKEIVKEALEETREQLQETDSEKHLIKAVKTLEETEASIKDRKERFADWYALHFPELVEELETESLVKVLKSGIRRDQLESFGGLAEDSKGSNITEKEEKMLKEMRENLGNDLEFRETLQSYIDETVKEEMPNLSVLLGTDLAAKIVALAGGLEDLARKPASTVQMLGAEKALFRHLRGNGSSPKHGVLIEHEFVEELPEASRGKMARFLANKTVMAARMDAYSGKEEGERLREECREKFEELR